MVTLSVSMRKNAFAKPWARLGVTLGLLLILVGLLPSGLWAADPDPGAAQAIVTKPEPPRTVARNYNGQVPRDEIKQQLDGFFNGLMKDDIGKSFATLLQGTRLSARENSIDSLIQNTQHAYTLYGRMTGFEPIDTYAVGTHLIITTYLAVLPSTPLRWRFVFYKTDATWQLLDLRVDDQISDIVEQ